MVAGPRIKYTDHALERMFERRIEVADVRTVLNQHEVLESYPDDLPFPSQLVLGWCGTRPLHAVIGHEVPENTLILITIYEPEPHLWTADFKRRREP